MFNKLKYSVLGISLFIIGLCIPNLSFALLVFMFIVLVLTWRKNINRDLVFQISLLFLFCVSYYLIAVGYGFTSTTVSIKWTLVMISAYAIGYSINYKNTKNWPLGILKYPFLYISGFIVFISLCIYKVVGSNIFREIPGRDIISFWEDAAIQTTTTGDFSSLGICLFPTLFFGLKRDSGKLFFLSFCLIIVLGFYQTILSQNRAPIIVLLLSIVFSLFQYYSKSYSAKRKRRFFLYVLIFSVCLYLINHIGIDKLLLVTRFQKEGLSSSRFFIWRAIVKEIPKHLMGGTNPNTSSILSYESFSFVYAHNLWFDIILTTGIIPVGFLLLFQVLHLKSLFTVLHSNLPNLLKIFFICVCTSILISFLLGEIIRSSMHYFCFSCFFLGLLKRLSLDTTKLSEMPTVS